MARRFYKRIGLYILLGALLASCSNASAPTTASVTPTLAPSPVLTYFRTSTPSSSPSGLPPTSTPLPSPTPTPLLYAVKGDDDMFGIALRYGVSLPSLKTANPKVNPYFMGVGTLLVIPVTPPTPGTGTPPAETPTPPPVTLSQPWCYPTADGGLWCLVSARSQQAQALENLSVVFRLSGKNPDTLIDQVAYAPMDILTSRDTLPVAIFFPAPAPQEYSVETRLDSVLPVPAGDTRYWTASFDKEQIELQGMAAKVSGEVVLPGASTTPVEVWVLAVAYGQKEQVVGLRKWEISSTLQRIPFELVVYSLGPNIQTVSLQVEAHQLGN